MNIIFDFDGTLVDSLPLLLDIGGQMLGEEHILNKTDINKLRNMSAKEILKFSGIPYWKLPGLLVKGRKILASRLDELKVFPGMADVVRELHTQHEKMYLVSSNGDRIIRKVLKTNDLNGQFDAIYGNVALFNKARALKKVIKDKNLDINNCIYVGDEVRDIEAAHKAGLKIASVTWGYNSKKILTLYKPNYLVETPADLRKVLE